MNKLFKLFLDSSLRWNDKIGAVILVKLVLVKTGNGNSVNFADKMIELLNPEGMKYL